MYLPWLALCDKNITQEVEKILEPALCSRLQ